MRWDSVQKRGSWGWSEVKCIPWEQEAEVWLSGDISESYSWKRFWNGEFLEQRRGSGKEHMGVNKMSLDCAREKLEDLGKGAVVWTTLSSQNLPRCTLSSHYLVGQIPPKQGSIHPLEDRLQKT